MTSGPFILKSVRVPLEVLNIRRALIEHCGMRKLGLDLYRVTKRACWLSPAGSFVFIAADF
jgi:hypothetical protein